MTEITEAEKSITRIVKKYKRQNGGSDSETSIYNVLHSMIEAGLAGSKVCIGTLDPWNAGILKEVMSDEGAMHRIGRLIWWGEGL